MIQFHPNLVVISAWLALSSALPAQPLSPVDLWKNFDPDAGDFKEEIVKEETRNGVYQRESYISAYVNDREIRVYCKYAVNAGARKAPGLMDVHGWMGAPGVDMEYVENGWAVMSHDYCGKTGNRPHFTKYPETLRHGNMDEKEGLRIKSKLPDGQSITDPKRTDDYLWYAVQRRVLSYLLAQKEVDPDRIGAKGYSYGGTIMWNLGMDSRVKAIVAYFGIGWLEYYRTRGVWMYDQPANEPGKTPGENLYLSAIAPQAHAPHITAASLWLNGTNDHHGGHERGEETFKMFQPGVPWSFAHQPRGHHDTRDIGQNTRLWLDKHVLGKEVPWPGPAASKISLDPEGIPELRITPADPGRVAELKMYYALKNPVSFARAWRDTVAVRKGDTWVGKMPVLNIDDYVFGFANIKYDSAIVRSSPFTAAIPGRLGKAVATDKPSATLGEGAGSWLKVGPVEGKGGIKGFRVLSSRGTQNEQFSDPKWKAPRGAQLSFKFYCTEPQELIMMVNQTYGGELDITASGEWQEMVLPAGRFLNRHNQLPMEDWSAAASIQLKPGPGADITRVVFADFKWVGPEKPKARPQASPPGPGPVGKKLPPGPRVHLAKEMASVSESFAKVVNDRAWQGTPIRVGGKIYQRGLGVHADSRLVFPLHGKFAAFHVVPGPDDAHHGTIEMRILVDEKEVFNSGPANSRDGAPREALTIPVKGARTLSLIVTQSDGNRGGDHASWADAWLEPAGEVAPAPAAPPVAAIPLPREKLEPFLKAYCVKCHGEEKQKGQVRFDQADWEITNNDNAQRWQDVLDQLNGGDMPPEDEAQPAIKELSAALDSLTGAIVTARKRLTDHGGEIKMRRLNRREYSNTIRDLFGFEVAFDDIPEDGEYSSFDTVGEEQFFTSSHFEKYLELGKKVAAEALRFNTRSHAGPTVSRAEPEKQVTEKTRKNLADLDRKMEMKKEGKTWKEMGFQDEGEMAVTFQQWDSRAELPRRYLQYPLVDQGVYNCDVAKWVSIARHIDIRAEYIVRINGGIVGEPDELRKIVRLWDRHQIRGTLKMAGTPQRPETVELRARQPMGRFQLDVNVRENMPDDTINSMRGYLRKLGGPGDSTDPRAAIWIDWLEIEGPFYPDKRPKFEDILYPGMPTGGSSPLIGKDESARELIGKFAREAFRRRTPEEDYISGLHKTFARNRADGMDYRDAMIEVMGIVLASPAFLYLQEDSPAANPARRRLDNRELAIRLSYFLWSAPPDDELYAADLSVPDIYARQIDRILADPKSVAFRDGFISQWAEFDRYDAITVDTREHIRFNEGLQQDAKREVREFFGVLLQEDLPASNLIDSDFVTINPALAAHYGIEGVDSKTPGFPKVILPADSPRGGLMTQAAFLTTGSNGDRSSPVIRGALVMEKLLHDKPAPPPPNVPELGSASREPKTNREMVELHQKQAVCASCHAKMDVIGFGLENFDTIGRWRDTEKAGRKEVPIQPGGTLPGGAPFANVRDLKKALLDQEDRLAEELVESMLTYGLGRTIEFSDADDVAGILIKLKKDDYPVRTMVREIALSRIFTTK